MNGQLTDILSRIIDEYRNIFGADVVKVYLYGSYARGDFDDESDIDVIALVRCGRSVIAEKTSAMASFSSELDLEYGVMVSPCAVPYDEFTKYQSDLPFYSNILKEGIPLL